MSCHLLFRVETGSLLDLSVADWNDFCLSLLESITKTESLSNNQENALELSRDQVDELELLSDQLIKYQQDFITGKSFSKQNEWHSCITILTYD